MLRLLERFVLLVNSLGSVVMAVYAYTALWGTITLGIVQFPYRNPQQLTFSMFGWEIALPAILFAISQVVGPLARAPGNVWLYFLAMLTTIPSVGVVGFAGVRWLFGAYEATLYQRWALLIWTLAVVIEVIAIGIGARLLQRSWLGEGGGQLGH